tara:strand:- start:123 stop:422 length:300 start_codon:yes stop_codon:yes gene_type:complete
VIVRRRVLYFYAEEIRRPMNTKKLKDIKKFETNSSYLQVVYLKADLTAEISDLMRNDLENQRNNLMEETDEMKENNMFKQMMDLEHKIKSNELLIYSFT